MNRTTIEAVRVSAPDGSTTEFQWEPDAWYVVRDDCPFLDVLVTGHYITAVDSKAPLSVHDELGRDGARWQRWDLTENLSRDRRVGEITLPLKVPKRCSLRCYVIPIRLLDLPDVLQMIHEIEAEIGTAVVWERSTGRPDRAWSRREQGHASAPERLIELVDEELYAARAVRHQPFVELAPLARRGITLPENALVSHWAVRRFRELEDAARLIDGHIEMSARLVESNRAPKRLERIQAELNRLKTLAEQVGTLRANIAPLVAHSELSTPMAPGPSHQRDHRLRRLLRAFAPPTLEQLSPFEATVSTYPPIRLNRLWELWGAVWIAKQLRALGFEGGVSPRGPEGLFSCTWTLCRGDVQISLDYEADPTLVDTTGLPPAHERLVPALEWASARQELDVDRPFLGLELKCSPDYLIRISTPTTRTLIVGDACLGTPEHHGTGEAKAKPYTVEHYRRTLGWAVDGQVVRCHPMGGFVVFPPPASSWHKFENLQDVRDCTLLCPSPRAPAESSARLENLLNAVAPQVRWREALAS